MFRIALIALSSIAAFSGATMGASPPPTKASGADEKTVRTVAVVNDSVISTFDLDQRVRLLLVTSGQNPTPDLIKRYRPQVLKTLIDEMLQTQEAFKFKVQVGNEEVDKSVARIAQQNNAQVNDIFKMLESQGVTRGTLQGQLRTELAWQKFVQGRFSSRVVISPD
ncbi:MAG TPA: peptidylprolyl isomerase, partial [Alphaproteobacteria bacterium]|nr:peptidylprolyl isomerase [Alphaproteobacteria bacterium]